MNFLSNQTQKINLVIGISIFLYLVRIVLFPLPVQTGGSELSYWAYFKDYLNLFENFEYEYMQNFRWFPQEWRWGFYILPIILNIFFENINILYFFGSLCMFLSFVIFLITIKKFYSLLPICFFIFTWIIHPDLEKFTFSFSTNSVSILILSIIIFLLAKLDLKNIELRNFIVLLILFFWLYGTKEANLIFATFIPVIFFLNKNIKNFIIISSLAAILYLIEASFVYLITDGQNPFGRFFYHFVSTDTYAWLNHVTSEHLRWGSPQYSVKNYSREFIDGGIFSRWFSTGLTLNFFYIFALIKAFDNINKRKNNFIFNISILYLCYFFTISLALVEFFPPKPLIHFNLGIQVLGFPLALIILVDFFEEYKKNFSNKYLFLFIFSFVAILINLKSLNNVNKISLKLINYNNYNIFSFKNNLIDVADKINTADCVYFKGFSNHIIYVFGQEYVNSNVIQKIKNFIIEDVDSYIALTAEDKFYEIKINDKCDKKIKIKKFRIIE